MYETKQKCITKISVFSIAKVFFCLWGILFLTYTSDCQAVNSKITRHASAADFEKGETTDVIVGSKGILQLGRSWEMPVEEFQDVWSINSLVVSGPTIYIGTSPDGGIYKYTLGRLEKIYPTNSEQEEETTSDNSEDNSEANSDENSEENSDPNKPETIEKDQRLSNEHIFAMSTDVTGRLLAGISGDKCKLLRFETGKAQTVYEPNDAKYIFAIATDKKGNIYLGTGPEGKIYRIDPFSSDSTGLLYDSLDNNILSLAVGDDGFLYAGSDERGLVYKINPKDKTATVLYDSPQPEITALLFGPGRELYAAATSAEMAKVESKFASQSPLAGRPETGSPKKSGSSKSDGGLKLQIPNTKKSSGKKSSDGGPSPRKPAKPAKASYIYKISGQGFVTDVFTEAVVLFAMAKHNDELLVGTGNSARLFTLDPEAEEQAVVYEDKQASQITALAISGQDVYLGTANPPRLIKLGNNFVREGTFTSDLVDAGQPAKWGKLQIEADIPQGCKIMLASRSGNVEDINDPTFSEWTEPIQITGPTQLTCPLGRFCQYKLILKNSDQTKTPVIQEVAIAAAIPNLAPKVESVTIERVSAAGKKGFFKIGYKAKDDNDDKLTYEIGFRKISRTGWIKLEDEIETDTFEFNGKTVEDGRYEIRVIADDARSNTVTTKLTGTRISDPVIVDNTGPKVTEYNVENFAKKATLKMRIVDELSTIAIVEYTIDSNEKWKGAIPDDGLFDTTDETFTIITDKLEPGEHIISVRIADGVRNATYKTFDIIIADN
ncbi:MAG: hypothetical protein ACYSWP_05300 [Planctomycetota bacterium]|jgi:hypothetical protein